LGSENGAPQSNEAIKLNQLPPGEDVGDTILRPQPLREEVTATSLLLIPKEENISQAADAPPAVDIGELIVLDLDAPIIRNIPAATSATASMPTTAKPKKVKVKVKRDMIDDIFG
jgi:hypothetical protein